MSAPARTAWLDSARGIAIVLVVLLHATQWLDLAGLRSPAWTAVHEVATGIRIPLFFLVAGMLAQRRTAGSWRSLVVDRLALLVWVYLLWQVVGSATALVAAQITGDTLTPARMAASLAATVVRPRFELWFLWDLAVFLVLARATRRVPVPAQLAVAGALSAVALSSLVPEVNLGWNGVPRFYLFFLLGVHGRLVLALAPRLSWTTSLGLTAGWLGLAVSMRAAGLDDVPGLGLLVRLAGAAAGVALAVRLSRVPGLGALGRRTLPIYLAHTPVVVVIAWLVPGGPPGLLTPAVGLVAVAVSLVLFRLLGDTPLYRPPERVTARLRRADYGGAHADSRLHRRAAFQDRSRPALAARGDRAGAGRRGPDPARAALGLTEVGAAQRDPGAG